MKNLTIIIIALLSSQVDVYSQKLNCNDFRLGKFELIDTENNIKYIYERFNTFQTEETFDLKTGKVIDEKGFYNIIWINECEYNLMSDTSKNKADETELYVNSKGGITSKITSIQENCATIFIRFENNDYHYKICKIK